MTKTKKRLKLCLSVILCSVLIAAMAQSFTGCNDSPQESPRLPTGTATAASTSSSPSTDSAVAPLTVKGEGNTIFYFNVVDETGAETKYEIHTDKTTVGDALLQLGLIEGEEGPYGLYVKTVNGITADYDTNGTYWAFYVGDDYGMTGVDLTEIEAGATYAFKVSK